MQTLLIWGALSQVWLGPWLGKVGEPCYLSYFSRNFDLMAWEGAQKLTRPLEAQAHKWHTIISATFYWPKQVTRPAESRGKRIRLYLLMVDVVKSRCKGRWTLEGENYWGYYYNPITIVLFGVIKERSHLVVPSMVEDGFHVGLWVLGRILVLITTLTFRRF